MRQSVLSSVSQIVRGLTRKRPARPRHSRSLAAAANRAVLERMEERTLLSHAVPTFGGTAHRPTAEHTPAFLLVGHHPELAHLTERQVGVGHKSGERAKKKGSGLDGTTKRSGKVSVLSHDDVRPGDDGVSTYGSSGGGSGTPTVDGSNLGHAGATYNATSKTVTISKSQFGNTAAPVNLTVTFPNGTDGNVPVIYPDPHSLKGGTQTPVSGKSSTASPEAGTPPTSTVSLWITPQFATSGTSEQVIISDPNLNGSSVTIIVVLAP